MKNASLQCDLRRVKALSRYFILIIAGVLLFLWPNAGPAYAEVIVVQQTDYSHETGNSFTNVAQSLGTGLSGSVDTIKVYVKKVAACDKLNVSLWEYDDGSYTTAHLVNDYWFGEIILTDNFQILSLSTSTITLNPTHYYAVGLYNSSYYPHYSTCTGQWRMLGSNNSNSYPNGCNAYLESPPNYYNLAGCYSEYGVTADIYFILSYNPPNLIQIDFPENATTTADFFYWEISGNLISTPPAHILVDVGESSSTINQFAGDYILDATGAFDISNVYKPSVLKQNTTYYARAWLQECLTWDLYSVCIPSVWNNPDNPTGYFTNLASSTIISFTTTEEEIIGGYYPSPTSTASSSEWVITCDPTSGFFANSLCNLFKYLFSPKQSDLQQFTNLKTALEHKAPIGYFYSFAQALGGFNASSTPAFVLTGLSSLTSITEPLDVGLTVIIYIVFAFYVFYRIKKLEL